MAATQRLEYRREIGRRESRSAIRDGDLHSAATGAHDDVDRRADRGVARRILEQVRQNLQRQREVAAHENQRGIVWQLRGDRTSEQHPFARGERGRHEVVDDMRLDMHRGDRMLFRERKPAHRHHEVRESTGLLRDALERPPGGDPRRRIRQHRQRRQR